VSQTRRPCAALASFSSTRFSGFSRAASGRPFSFDLALLCDLGAKHTEGMSDQLFKMPHERANAPCKADGGLPAIETAEFLERVASFDGTYADDRKKVEAALQAYISELIVPR